MAGGYVLWGHKETSFQGTHPLGKEAHETRDMYSYGTCPCRLGAHLLGGGDTLLGAMSLMAAYLILGRPPTPGGHRALTLASMYLA